MASSEKPDTRGTLPRNDAKKNDRLKHQCEGLCVDFHGNKFTCKKDVTHFFCDSCFDPNSLPIPGPNWDNMIESHDKQQERMAEMTLRFEEYRSKVKEMEDTLHLISQERDESLESLRRMHREARMQQEKQDSNLVNKEMDEVQHGQYSLQEYTEKIKEMAARVLEMEARVLDVERDRDEASVSLIKVKEDVLRKDREIKDLRDLLVIKDDNENFAFKLKGDFLSQIHDVVRQAIREEHSEPFRLGCISDMIGLPNTTWQFMDETKSPCGIVEEPCIPPADDEQTPVCVFSEVDEIHFSSANGKC